MISYESVAFESVKREIALDGSDLRSLQEGEPPGKGTFVGLEESKQPGHELPIRGHIARNCGQPLVAESSS